jgi:hypothetical protein
MAVKPGHLAEVVANCGYASFLPKVKSTDFTPPDIFPRELNLIISSNVSAMENSFVSSYYPLRSNAV